MILHFTGFSVEPGLCIIGIHSATGAAHPHPAGVLVLRIVIIEFIVPRSVQILASHVRCRHRRLRPRRFRDRAERQTAQFGAQIRRRLFTLKRDGGEIVDDVGVFARTGDRRLLTRFVRVLTRWRHWCCRCFLITVHEILHEVDHRIAGGRRETIAVGELFTTVVGRPATRVGVVGHRWRFLEPNARAVRFRNGHR